MLLTAAVNSSNMTYQQQNSQQSRQEVYQTKLEMFCAFQGLPDNVTRIYLEPKKKMKVEDVNPSVNLMTVFNFHF